jgi:hypothetical protein
MADRPNNEPEPKDETKQTDAEYGLGQILSPDEEQMKKARETSGYHYTEEQLEHKEDRID